MHSHPIIRMENSSRIAWPILTHVRLCFVIHRTLNPRNLYSMFEHCGCHNSRPSVDENRRNGTTEIIRLAALMQELLTKSFRVSLQRNAFCLTTQHWFDFENVLTFVNCRLFMITKKLNRLKISIVKFYFLTLPLLTSIFKSTQVLKVEVPSRRQSAMWLIMICIFHTLEQCQLSSTTSNCAPCNSSNPTRATR